MEHNSHLANTCTHTTTVSMHGCVGTAISWFSSFAVGIQKDSRPSSTSVSDAKCNMSSSMAWKL